MSLPSLFLCIRGAESCRSVQNDHSYLAVDFESAIFASHITIGVSTSHARIFISHLIFHYLRRQKNSAGLLCPFAG
jgi:hypothetical protein